MLFYDCKFANYFMSFICLNYGLSDMLLPVFFLIRFFKIPIVKEGK